MTRFLALCSATLCSILSVALLVGSYASANNASALPALSISQGLVIQRKDKDPINISHRIFSYAFGEKSTRPASTSEQAHNQARESYRRALQDGQWGAVQGESLRTGSAAEVRKKWVVLFWTEDKNPLRLGRSGNAYTLDHLSGPSIHYLTISATPDGKGSVSYYTSNKTWQIIISMVQPNNYSHSLGFFAGKYTLAPGLEGLPELPGTPTEKRQPDFTWTLSTDGTFRASYMKNVEELKGNERFCSWRYTVQRKNHNYTENVGDAFNSDRVNLYAFAHKLEEHGNYEVVVRIDCNFHPPALPKDLSWIKPVTFRFKFDGNLLFGTTFDGNCADGICKPTPQTCADIKDALPRISCNMREMFGTGVLNGSLVAAQDLARSFIVSSSPSCGLPLASTGNRMLDTVNPGKMVSVACEKTKTFYHAFPIATVVVNFLAASLLLWMIVRMFNNLTDHRKDNMIGGL